MGGTGATRLTACASTRGPRRCDGWSLRWPRRQRSAARSHGPKATGSSSPTFARSCRETAFARSTGAPARAAATSWSTNAIQSGTPTSSSFSTRFVDARRLDASSLDRAVRATSTLASHYLERRDRVGLVALGGTFRWLQPGGGLVQRYRLIDALLETEVVFTYAWKDANIIPARTLPPRALDRRSHPAARPARDRRPARSACARPDLVVVEVSPLDLVEPGAGDDDRLAYRLWRLRREELVSALQRGSASPSPVGTARSHLPRGSRR